MKNFNLMYCSNIFKIDKIKNLIKILNKFIKILKKKNLSLCLSNKLVCEINKNKNIFFFKKWIKKKNIEINSINAFVYKNFHKKIIKYDIHYPDWTTNYRLNYTKKIILTLNKLLKKRKNVSISTSPISHKKWIKQKHFNFIFYKSTKNIARIFIQLINIKNKFIHLDIEPEPGCLINNSKKYIFFIKLWLIPFFKCIFHEKKIHFNKKIHKSIKKYINLCYDISHFSVNFENHKNILINLRKEKLKIGKIQISSALEIKKKTYKIKKILLKMKKSPFLHQTVLKTKKYLYFYNDIPKYKNIFKNSIMRIHCHIPLYKKKYKNIKTTINETKDILKTIITTEKIKHFEIESYTYSCLIGKNKFKSIIKEYKWFYNVIKNDNC